MAYVIDGGEGSFTTVTGDAFYTSLFGVNNSAGLCTVNSWTLAIASDPRTVTALNSANYKTLTGLRSYSARISGYAYAIPRVGNLGLVTMATPAFYAANAKRWSLTLEPVAVHDVTAYHASAPGSGPTWRAFRPSSTLRWSGSYTCGFDTDTILRTGAAGTEPIQAPSITDDTASTDLSDIVLTYGDSAADESFTGEVAITGYSVPVQVGNQIEVTFDFQGSGPITATGTNIMFTGSNAISAGVIKPPVWSGNGSAALVARFYEKVASTSRYHETADMFWERFTINAAVGEPVTIDVAMRGTGALTVN